MVGGDGHYLGHSETLRRMETDFPYPRSADRRTHEQWAAEGSLDIRQVANRRARDILATHFPGHLDGEVERTLRLRFDIQLSVEAMRPE